ncbi:hypothetical protein DC3_54720 [Deinococcus cellulosilyticus NBRC 106333 = KACC 11606]|uniref:Uncharacterized protein n=1 Tax=Deinococcus cellulosilyticus (strain DSM 18568 / NBRC 106333 / KACC 11606 / 5516J-15) TaxID=1223518 RepID=A0A511NB72_DEIC1|nr:hypothetical protein DC3_54720 [Deinococcus cellulosilyticus NBRC 106333 = KACC 11606]
MGHGVDRIAPAIRNHILARIHAQEPLEAIQVTVLKYAGITLKNPRKFNSEDAAIVMQALGA